MDAALNDFGFVTSQKKMLLFDFRNYQQPIWDSRNFENKNIVSNSDNLNLNYQLVKIKCFPLGGG